MKNLFKNFQIDPLVVAERISPCTPIETKICCRCTHVVAPMFVEPPRRLRLADALLRQMAGTKYQTIVTCQILLTRGMANSPTMGSHRPWIVFVRHEKNETTVRHSYFLCGPKTNSLSNGRWIGKTKCSSKDVVTNNRKDWLLKILNTLRKSWCACLCACLLAYLRKCRIGVPQKTTRKLETLDSTPTFPPSHYYSSYILISQSGWFWM